MIARALGGGLLVLALAGPAAAQQKAPATTPEGWQVESFTLSNKAEGFQVALTGYAQADFRSFHDWQVGDGTDPTERLDEFDWRRLRIGFEGEWRKLVFEFDVDPAFDEGDELKDARLGLRFGKEFEVDAGHIKLPVTQEWLGSAAKTDMIERAMVVNSLAPGRDWGVTAAGELGAFEYNVGVFEGDSRTNPRRAGTTGAARLLLKASWLEVGGSYSQGDVVADPETPGSDPFPKGLEGTSGTGYEFFPGVFVNGTRRRWGAEARLQSGPVSLWGEFLESREERKGQGPTLEDLPPVYGRGYSATATWLVTGERKSRTIRPGRSVFSGPGAIELSARYEELWFDDASNEGFESAGSRAANVRPAGISTITGGLSWWPNRVLRLSGNVLFERYDDALRAPEPGRTGNYVSLFGRLQVHLP
ncbi:MAG TPA: porin [Vicinamibacteria bacterium]